MEKTTLEQLAQERGKRMKYIRKDILHLSRIQISKKYNIPAGTIQNWEDARHGGLSEKGANLFIDVLKKEGLNCSLQWLMYGLGEKPAQLRNTFHHSSIITRMDNIKSETDKITQELALFFEHNPFAIDYRIIDDAMEPMLQKGDTVAGKRFTGDEIPKLLNKVCIVQTQSGIILVRILKLGKDRNCYDLIALNKSSKLDEIDHFNMLIITAAPVQWVRRI